MTDPTGVLVLNGPNLNLLGTREPDVYGAATLDDVLGLCRAEARRWGLDVEARQSNHEGVLVDWLQEAGAGARGGRPRRRGAERRRLHAHVGRVA